MTVRQVVKAYLTLEGHLLTRVAGIWCGDGGRLTRVASQVVAQPLDIEMYNQHGDSLGTSAYLRLDFAVDELEDPLVIITSAIDEDRSAAKAQGGPTP